MPSESRVQSFSILFPLLFVAFFSLVCCFSGASAIPQLGLMHPLRSADYSAGYNPLVNMFTPRGSGAGGSMQSGTIGLMQPMQSMQQQQPQAPLSPVQSAAPSTISRRFMHVQFAPHLAPATAEFVIEASGVRGTANVDEVAQMIAMSPSASPSAAQQTQAWEAAPSSASSISAVPMLQPLGGFASGAAAAGAPASTSFSYTRNMFTPSGNSAASSPSLSRQAGGASSGSPPAGSRFDDDDRTPQQREADERAELQMLAQAEEAMRIRLQQQAAANGLPVRSAESLFNSPTIQLPTQQQPRPNYWD